MKILVFGSTGRVGNAIAEKALNLNHQVIALVRNKNKLTIKNNNLNVIVGDIYDKDILDKLNLVDFDILVNVIGADPLKPSTIFSDTTGLILKFLEKQPQKHYIAITGIAQMEKTFFGKVTIGILKLTPVKNAILDHQNAYNQVTTSAINWTLIGCPYIKDGPEMGSFKKDAIFRGSFKTIHPGDVANTILQQFNEKNYKKIIGIWY